MKPIVVILMAAFLATQITWAQETTYLSNLGQTPFSAEGIGSNLWLGVSFKTGTNTGGYLLDSFQLSMANEKSTGGRPGGFAVTLYNDEGSGFSEVPENSLVTLNGSSDPSTAGIYTYTPPSNLTLSPNSFYSVVVTANTPYIGPQAAPEGYFWSYMTSPGESLYDPSGGWSDWEFIFSNDGVNWVSSPRDTSLYSLTAEPAPEPGTLGLSLLGTLFFIRRCRKMA